MYPEQTNKIRISKNTLEENYAYVNISNLKLEYLEINTVINDVKTNLNTLRYQLGNNVYISANKNQSENNLDKFLKNQDYLLVKKNLEWFLTKLDENL